MTQHTHYRWLIICPMVFAVALLAVACDDSSEPAPTGTLAVVPTEAPEVERPDPQTLIPSGAVLDESVEVSLDGGEPGQLVVVSHTATVSAESLPDVCPDNSVLAGDPSPCLFRVEIFAYDAASGWTGRYLEDDAGGEKPGASLIQGLTVRPFALNGDGREALVVTRVSCAPSNCPFESHTVLTMADGEVSVAYSAFQASYEPSPGGATFATLAYAEFTPLCCPNSRLVQTVGLVPESGLVGVIDAEHSLFCTEGTFALFSEEPEIVTVRCSDEGGSALETTTDTVVEPASVGGVAGLREGDRVSVEFFIKECPDSILDCDPSSMTPVATTITVLSQ